MLGLFTPQRPRGYSLYTHSSGLDAVPGDGLVTLVHDSIPHIPLQLYTALQALAHRVRLNKLYTISNIYISPRDHITANSLIQLIN